MYPVILRTDNGGSQSTSSSRKNKRILEKNGNLNFHSDSWKQTKDSKGYEHHSKSWHLNKSNKTEGAKGAVKRKVVCFRCGGDHFVKDCSEPEEDLRMFRLFYGLEPEEDLPEKDCSGMLYGLALLDKHFSGMFPEVSGIFHLERGVARSKSNGIIEREIRDFKSILRVKLQDQSSKENYTRLVSEALIGINITRGNHEFSPVEKLFICKWNFRGIQEKALIEKPERDLIDHLVWIKGKDNDLSKPLYQERGKIIRQFGNKQFEILLEDGKKTTLHINDLLL